MLSDACTHYGAVPSLQIGLVVNVYNSRKEVLQEKIEAINC